MEKIYITDVTLAKILNCAVQTLRNKRSQGTGIPWVKASRSVRYDLDDVIRYMEAHKITPQDCLTAEETVGD